MRVSVLALAVSVVLGVLAPLNEAQAQRSRVTVSHSTTVRYAPVTARRTIVRPVRGHRWTAPPPGAYLVRGRYWNPAVRWKTDAYTRSVYAVYRGEVWFLDPSTGWAYTVDRYGRIYTADPAYRAIYALGLMSDWRGEIPYFFGYFAPDDGYYALPRYRYFVSYYSSPRYTWYDSRRAYDYWWDTYDDYFYSPRWRSTVTFSYWDHSHVHYDRHYRRDVYIGDRGQRFVEREPPRTNRTWGRDNASVGPARGFTRADDAYLPVAPVGGNGRGPRAPGPRDADILISRQPAVPEVQVAPAIPVNAAAEVATNTQYSAPVPTIQEITAMERSAPPPADQPVSTFDSVPTIDTTIQPDPIPVTPVSTTEIPPLPTEPAATLAPVDTARPVEPGYSEPSGYSEPANVARDSAPAVVEPAYSEPAAVAPEAESRVSEPTYSEPAGYDEPSAGGAAPVDRSEPEPVNSEPAPTYEEPAAVQPEEPAYSEPEPSYAEPEPTSREPEPTYSEPEPSYSEPEPTYSEPEPSYAEPERAAEPEPTYSEPEPSYAEPERAAEPEPSYSEPEPSYSEPEPSYSEPAPSYSEPEPSYSEPEPSYSAPEPSYSEPEPSYSAPEPEPSYSAPEPSYSEPEPAREPEPEPERNYSSDEEGNNPQA